MELVDITNGQLKVMIILEIVLSQLRIRQIFPVPMVFRMQIPKLIEVSLQSWAPAY